MGRDFDFLETIANNPVSIHAPAWGATDICRLTMQSVRVSIHAPAWGATAIQNQNRRNNLCFNPRARMGRDKNHLHHVGNHGLFQSTRPHGARRRHQARNNPFHFVSIHAPAWGATRLAPKHTLQFTRFNPRARMGRDSVTAAFVTIEVPFQSTRPHGARRNYVFGSLNSS